MTKNYFKELVAARMLDFGNSRFVDRAYQARRAGR